MIKLSRAYVKSEEADAVREVLLQTVNFGMGVHVQQFEKDLEKFIGNDKSVLAVNNGTHALHIALESLNFQQNSEVLVPSITYLASYQAIILAGLLPVSVDVVPDTGQICVNDLERRITNKTAAIMPVAYSGADFDRKRVYEIASAHKLRVVEDDAHAFGGHCSDGKKFGASGDIICFSFDGIKNITCGEGGAVATSDQEVAHRIRTARSLGVENDHINRFNNTRTWNFDVKSKGFRYHMSNINAVIGSTQLKRLDVTKEFKSRIIKQYLNRFKETKLEQHLKPIIHDSSAYNFHIFPCHLQDDKFKRDDYRRFLLSRNIESGIHYAPNHLHTFFKSDYPLKNSMKFYSTVVSLPFHPGLTTSEIDTVVDSSLEFFAK